jgi:hypothetical protein
MPNFAVKPRTPSRFEGDFQIEPDGSYAPLDQEKEYLALIETVLNLLEEGKSRMRRPPTQPIFSQSVRRHAKPRRLSCNWMRKNSPPVN